MSQRLRASSSVFERVSSILREHVFVVNPTHLVAFPVDVEITRISSRKAVSRGRRSSLPRATIPKSPNPHPLPLPPSSVKSSRGVPRDAVVLCFPLLPDTVSPRRVRRAHVGGQAGRLLTPHPDARPCTALPRLPVDVYDALGQVGQARLSLEKQKGNPGAASVPLGPSGHPKLSDGRVAAGGGARLAAVDANSATVAVSSPALSAPVRRAAGPARRQTSEIQVVLKRTQGKRDD
jgi:hypothetical protein